MYYACLFVVDQGGMSKKGDGEIGEVIGFE